MNYDRIWTALVASFLAVFAVVETDSIRFGRRPSNHGKPHGTLSAWTQRKLGIHPKRPRRFILVPIFTLVWGWLGPHILWGIWNWGVLPEVERQ